MLAGALPSALRLLESDLGPMELIGGHASQFIPLDKRPSRGIKSGA
jgi:hypothetical protein